MIELTSLRSTSNLHPNVAIEHHIQLHSTLQYVDDAVAFFSYRRIIVPRETSLSTRHITSLAHIIEGHPYLYHINSESIFIAPHHSILDGLLREYQLVCWLLSLPFYEPIRRDIGIISPIFHLPINLPSTSSDYYPTSCRLLRILLQDLHRLYLKSWFQYSVGRSYRLCCTRPSTR